MKKITVLALSLALFAVSCKESKADNAAATSTEQSTAAAQGDTYKVNAAESSVKWTAAHKGGLNPHYGTMKTEGTLTAEGNELTSGTLTSDVNSLTTDPKSVDPATSQGKKSTDLDAHLKSADFFDAAKYPTVKFAITKVENLSVSDEKSKMEGANKMVSGNLTIKGKTVNVTFPAKVDVAGNTISLASKFTINRKDWGLDYGTDGDPKDWMISSDVNLDLNIKATK